MIVDLTKKLDSTLSVFQQEGYRDPELRCSDWCRIADRGFWVSSVSLGTQTGTHIDAPAHFLEGGAPLETLSLECLLGSFYLIDLPRMVDHDSVLPLVQGYRGEPLLFLRCAEGESSQITEKALSQLLTLPQEVWILAGEISVVDAAEFEFNRRLARAGEFLIEDLDLQASMSVLPGGELIALPLALVGTGGAPCRVIVRQ